MFQSLILHIVCKLSPPNRRVQLGKLVQQRRCVREALLWQGDHRVGGFRRVRTHVRCYLDQNFLNKNNTLTNFITNVPWSISQRWNSLFDNPSTGNTCLGSNWSSFAISNNENFSAKLTKLRWTIKLFGQYDVTS